MCCCFFLKIGQNIVIVLVQCVQCQLVVSTEAGLVGQKLAKQNIREDEH